MRVALYFLFVILFLTSCSLNSEQEKSLSEATTNYLEARKKGAILAIVSMVHPDVVKAYRDQGDSIFVEKFTYAPEDHFLSDPVIKHVKKKGANIHVMYEVKAIEEAWGGTKKSLDPFIAISSDEGKSWFFVDRSDYVNKSIAKELDRLISLKE